MAGLQTKGSRLSGKADTTNAGKATKADVLDLKRAGKERDKPLEAAYNAGRRGDDPAEYQTDDELYGYYQDGQKAARAQARQRRRDQLTGAAGKKAGSFANDGAGFLLGLFAYALLANYLRNGVPGVKGWLRAKFLNEPMGSSGASEAAKPAVPAAPTGPANVANPARVVPINGGGM